MINKSDYPLVFVEREWLEAIEELHSYDTNRYQDLIGAAIGKAAGKEAFLSINDFDDNVTQQYWSRTIITPALINGDNVKPGRISWRKKSDKRSH